MTEPWDDTGRLPPWHEDSQWADTRAGWLRFSLREIPDLVGRYFRHRFPCTIKGHVSTDGYWDHIDAEKCKRCGKPLYP